MSTDKQIIYRVQSATGQWQDYCRSDWTSDRETSRQLDLLAHRVSPSHVYARVEDWAGNAPDYHMYRTGGPYAILPGDTCPVCTAVPLARHIDGYGNRWLTCPGCYYAARDTARPL